MNTRKQTSLRKRLEAMAERLRGEAATSANEALTPSTGVRGGELSNVPFHLADMGTEEFLSMMNATLLENELQLAVEVQAALDRLDDGTYGTCEACGKSIAGERLDALPFVRHCIDCAKAQEDHQGTNLNAGRPHGPHDTLAPEGEMLENRGGATAGTRGRDLSFRHDEHAAGEAGGGTAFGGLAGTNIGHGDPAGGDLQAATGSGERDVEEARGIAVDEPTERF